LHYAYVYERALVEIGSLTAASWLGCCFLFGVSMIANVVDMSHSRRSPLTIAALDVAAAQLTGGLKQVGGADASAIPYSQNDGGSELRGS